MNCGDGNAKMIDNEPTYQHFIDIFYRSGIEFALCYWILAEGVHFSIDLFFFAALETLGALHFHILSNGFF